MERLHYTLKGYPLFANDYTRFHRYWWLYYLNPKNYYRTIKYFFQRGWRGYADCDHWDMDSYMESVLIELVKDLREHAHGFPAYLVDEKALEVLNEEYVDGMTKWHTILDTIIDGLEASIDLRQEITVPKGVYSEEPLRFVPYEGSDELMTLAETDTPRFNKELYEEWAEPLRKRRRKALVLLAKHWGSFWD